MLVNNAGYAVWKPLEETAPADWDRTFAVNVRAAARLCAAVLPGMQARRFGRIINIGSEAGVAIVPGLAAYCVSKHALVALTEVIQDGNHDNGIKAWVICPGFVDTAMGYVVPGANPASFLTVEEVVDVGPLPAAHRRQRQTRPADPAAHHAQPHGGASTRGTVMTANGQVPRPLDTPALLRLRAAVRQRPEHAHMRPAPPLAEGKRSRSIRRVGARGPEQEKSRDVMLSLDGRPTSSMPWLFPAAKMAPRLGGCAQTLQFGHPPYLVPTMQRATPGNLTLPSSS